MLPGKARDIRYEDKHKTAHTIVDCGLQIAVKLASVDLQCPAKQHTATYSVTLWCKQTGGFITRVLVKKGLYRKLS
jgi:hypothetical protein